MGKVKKIPIRTCIGCGTKRPKKELLRVVRSPDLVIAVDRTGKRSGRGAYICPNFECLERANHKNRLAGALETELTPENLAEVKEQLAGIINAPPPPGRIHR